MDGAVKRNRIDPTQWLLGGILAVLLAIFGYLMCLRGEVSAIGAQVKVLNDQMHDSAELVGKLVLKGNP
jgi:hypothetical protein